MKALEMTLLPLGEGVGKREAFDFAFVVAVALNAFISPFAVAAESAGKTRRAKGMDARVFLQDRDVL